jgi:hypothetical protein
MADQLQFVYTPGWLIWLGENTGIGHVMAVHGRWPGFTQRDKYIALQNAIKAIPSYGLVYDTGGVQTILTTSYRLAYEDRREPRVLEGIRITKDMLLRIQSRTNAAHVKLIVLLIPTKELVYSKIISARNELDDTYRALVQMETQNREEMRGFCTDHAIQVADALPALQDAADRNQAIYQASSDGHPQANGYALIAGTVNAALNNR